MTTLEDASAGPAVTPVTLGGARGGPDVATLRTDRYWVQPVVTFVVLTSFVAYASWAAFVNKNYYVGASFNRDLISPFYSPCLVASCVPGAGHTAHHPVVDDLAGAPHPDLPAGFPDDLLLLPQGLLPVVLAGPAGVCGVRRPRRLHR